MSVAATSVWFSLFKNSGSSDMAVNGSVTPVDFDVVSSGYGRIYRLAVQIIDGSIRPTTFGGLAALTNGLLVRAIGADDAVLVDFLDGLPIKRNSDWVRLSGTAEEIIAAAGDDHFGVRWTLRRGLGSPLRLSLNEKLRITVQDDLTSITEFRIVAQGRA